MLYTTLAALNIHVGYKKYWSGPFLFPVFELIVWLASSLHHCWPILKDIHFLLRQTWDSMAGIPNFSSFQQHEQKSLTSLIRCPLWLGSNNALFVHISWPPQMPAVHLQHSARHYLGNRGSASGERLRSDYQIADTSGQQLCKDDSSLLQINVTSRIFAIKFS